MTPTKTCKGKHKLRLIDEDEEEEDEDEEEETLELMRGDATTEDFD